VAPQEMDAFQVVSDAYFADPQPALADGEGHSRPVGAARRRTETLLTPVLLAAITDVTRQLVSELMRASVVDDIEAAQGVVRRLFTTEGGQQRSAQAGRVDILPELNVYQWEGIRQIVVRTALRYGLPLESAELLGNAVLSAGQSSEPADRPE